MMTYRVITYFADLEDNNHVYHTGDAFPREGKDVKPSRLVELSGSDDKRGIPLIEGYTDDEAEAEPKEEVKAEPKKRGRKKGTDNGNGDN